MTKRIFRATLTVALTVLLASLILIVGVLHGYFQDRVLDELSSRTSYIALGIEHEGIDYLENGFPNDCRVTWVAADGAVLWDNREDPAGMQNHADRPEVHEALLLGRGHAARYSDTLSQKTLYYALRLSDGSVLRVSDTQYSVWILVLQALQPVALVMVLAFCLALWLAGRLARQLVEPINAVDLNDPGEEIGYEELAPLVGKLRSQKRQINRQMEDLRRSREEFAAITENMSEGLIIIDRETRVLSHNAAALRLLDAQAPTEEDSVLALNREPGFRRCVEEALAGHRREELLEREDTCCRVLANPVEQDGAVTGAVLIVLDVTEKERREALRREFTANVSHELKTPLTSILGTAEILENGLVKPEDIPHFAGNIHREAQRLIGLVNDIIKLSRLDEGDAAAQWETVDLRATAEEVLRQLAPAAEKQQVTMTLEGGPTPVRGVPQIVEEIIYNLCDNAIAYNRPGGSVGVTLSSTPEGERVTVSDTGIGIPQELRERVFERFYRVDKSHSGGGTGLGLSIVKHGAAYLGARVELDSEPGKGSAFTLTFPPHSETWQDNK
ncbi:sensor histidine kinase [Oscillibacter sp.]|uniref:sensor histidine kinase n=1 Tax=Oscillibacter sp. TaxID=1945593 RepID=UPI001B5B3B97|nr:ATP-binding protein [Oscillibacter sp.]MBP3508433.1 PAS domain-containing protein [Oscillibacter sp.]